MKGNKRQLTMAQKRSLQGYLYILPWIIGFLAFFLYPIVKTAIFSLNSLDKSTLQLTFVGFKNFADAFTQDANFPQILAGTVVSLVDVPLILVFSYFIALLLKKDFKGNTIVKSVFFLTVVLSSVLFFRMQMSTSDVNNAQIGVSIQESKQIFTMLKAMDISGYFVNLGISPAIMEYINNAISNIFYIMIRSGIQIFIFLAALHSIPDSMYEASTIEGATGWESFWKITFPMTGPIILVNLVYTVVDSFGSYLNKTVQYIYDLAFNKFNFGYSSALSWIYFICIAAIMGLIFLLFRKKVFYQND